MAGVGMLADDDQRASQRGFCSSARIRPMSADWISEGVWSWKSTSNIEFADQADSRSLYCLSVS